MIASKRAEGGAGGRQKSAAEIYQQQNTIIHSAMARIGMPYQTNKACWIKLFSDIAGRKVEGLSELTLAERRAVIRHMAARIKHYRIYNPGVPRDMRGWKKGDPEQSYEYVETADDQLKMAYALLLELGQRPQKMGVIVRARYGISHERWLSGKQLSDLVTYLVYRVKNSKQ